MAGALSLYLCPFFVYLAYYLSTGNSSFAWLLDSEPYGFYELSIAPFTFFTFYLLWKRRHFFSKAFSLCIGACLSFYLFEEFSYGQHFVPKGFYDEFVPQDNSQNELNFHNIVWKSIEMENVVHHLFFFALTFTLVFWKSFVLMPVIALTLIVERTMNFMLLEGFSELIFLDVNEVLEGLLSLLILMNFWILHKRKEAAPPSLS